MSIFLHGIVRNPTFSPLKTTKLPIYFMRLLFLLLAFLVAKTIYPQDLDYNISRIDQNLLTGAEAVVRLNKMHVELASKRNMRVAHKRVVTILNEKGNRHSQAFVNYDKGMSVKNAMAIIYNQGGEVIEKIRQKDFVDISAVESGTLYSDSRVLYMSYLPIEYPYTIEFSYNLVTDNTGIIPSWYFIDDYLVSTERSEFTIAFSSLELKPAIKEKNLDDMLYEFEETESSLSYSAYNIPLIKNEELSPALKKIVPCIKVRPVNFHYEGFDGSIDSWKDAGDWMRHNILKNQDELDPETVQMAQKLVEGVRDDLEKAKIIYRYVQENTRYISVQVGIGGLKPTSAIEVNNLKYGDCKGLSNYTQALLKAVGVESYYVHVEAGQDKFDFEDDFANLAAGNHVILAIPYNEKFYWIDCTSQTTPFGFIGDFTDDRKVLVIKPQGGELIRTVGYSNGDNLKKMKVNYAITKEGGLLGDVHVTSKGIRYDRHYLLETLPKKDVEEYYKEYWNNVNNVEVRKYSFKNDKNQIVFEEEIKLAASKYASLSDNKMIFVVNAFNNSQFVPKRYRERKFPLEIQRGYVDEDVFEIQLPEGFVIDAMPVDRSLKAKFGSYNVSFSNKESRLTMRRRLQINKGTYPPEEYGAYRKFRRSVARFDNSKIILKKTTTP